MRRAFVLSIVLALVGCTSKRSPLREEARAAHGPEMSHAIPIFNVHSLKVSQQYYRDVLGFKVEWEAGEPPDFTAVIRAEARIFMCQGCQGNPGAWIMIFTHDVDELHKEYKRKGAIIRMPPTTMPWQLREMHISDRDGNVIRFASDTEH